MKKILFMMFDMRCGGIEKSLITLLNKLDYTKASVTLLLINEDGEYLEDIPKFVEVKTLDIPDKLKSQLFESNREVMMKLFRHRKLFRLIIWIINMAFYRVLGTTQKNKMKFNIAEKILPYYDDNYDLAIDFQGLGSGLFNTFYVSKKVVSNKKITWIHTDVSQIKGNLLWLSEYYKRYDKIFSVSKQAEKEFLNRFPLLKEKSDVFYNILPIEDIKELSKDSVCISKYNSKASVLSVGRLDYEKGYDVALKAVKMLVQDKYDFKYYIIGEGKQRNELENLISKYGLTEVVVLLGYRKNPYPLINACDIYFQPSRFEGFSLTLGEAKLLCKPIITTDFAGAREQIKNGKTGIIINFDQSEMYYALKMLLDDILLRSEMSSNLKELNIESINNIDKIYEMM